MTHTAVNSTPELSDKLLAILKTLEELESNARRATFEASPQTSRQHNGLSTMAIVADRICTAKQVLKPCAIWADTATADLAAEEVKRGA